MDETGVYTNKSEFIEEACRSHLRELNDDTSITALRLEQLLADAESNHSISDVDDELNALANTVDTEELRDAVEQARTETADQIYTTDE